MSGIRVLCDTNPLIYLLDGNKDIAGFLNNKQIHVSVITELELFGKPDLSEPDRKIIETMLENCFIAEDYMVICVDMARWETLAEEAE